MNMLMKAIHMGVSPRNLTNKHILIILTSGILQCSAYEYANNKYTASYVHIMLTLRIF